MDDSSNRTEFDFHKFQTEVHEWEKRNFGADQPPWCQIMGMTEELGELAHAYLKNHQGIRGTTQEHEAAMIDAIGDLTVYMVAFCSRMGLDFSSIVQNVWGVVKHRDWTKNSLTGRSDGEPVV